MDNWDKLKKLIHERDNYICQSCGKYPSTQVHNVIPRGQGGKDLLKNLITLCGKCHMLVSPVPDGVLIKIWKIKPNDLQNQKDKVLNKIQEFNN